MEVESGVSGSQILLGVLVLVGLIIVLKVLGLAVKAITLVVLLALIAGGIYLYSTGAIP